MALDTHREGSNPSAWRAWWSLAVFTFAAVVSYTDRFLQNVLVDPIRATFKLSDPQFSLLQGVAFALLYGVVGLILGYQADRRARLRLCAIGVVIWTLGTAACAMAGSFGQLFAARAAVGVGEAALAPSVLSMLHDLFPKSRGGLSAGLFFFGMYAGSSLSYAAGGLALQSASTGWLHNLFNGSITEPWRAVFLLFALPGVVLLLLMSTLREPPRASNSNLQSTPNLRAAITSPSVPLPLLYMAVAIFTAGDFAVMSWVPTYLQRVHGLSAAQAGSSVGVVYFCAAASGSVIGGALSDRARRRSLRSVLLTIMGVAAFFCVPGGCLGVASSAPASLVLLTIWTLGIAACGTMGIVAILNIAGSAVRGFATALVAFCNTAIGLSVGPTLLAALAQVFDHARGNALGLALTSTAELLIGSSLLFLLIVVSARSRDQSPSADGLVP
jgi:MFS family permease